MSMSSSQSVRPFSELATGRETRVDAEPRLSNSTKHYLEDLHENIAVQRHPDHMGGEVTLFWSHHEKMTIVVCLSFDVYRSDKLKRAF